MEGVTIPRRCASEHYNLMTDKISVFTKRLAENPNNRFHRYNLAQAYYDDGNWHQATEHFKICFELSPSWMMASLSLAKCYIALENFDLAEGLLIKTIELAREQHHESPLEEAESLLSMCRSG